MTDLPYVLKACSVLKQDKTKERRESGKKGNGMKKFSLKNSHSLFWILNQILEKTYGDKGIFDRID